MKDARQIKMRLSAKPGIVVIGELNVDLLASGLTDPPSMGDEILAKDFEVVLGSASAIFATGIRKLGYEVTFVSQVGRDQFGDFCVDALRAAGISTKQVSRRRNLKTGVTISLSGARDRALVTYPGAIATFSAEQVPSDSFQNGQHLHMTSYFLQTALKPSFAEIFRQARKRGLTTSFDPNSDPSGAWGKEIWDVLRETDVLFLNEREALKLTRTRTIKSAAIKLGQQTNCVVIKLGSKGAVAIKGGELVTAPGFKIKVVDTTGAGDSFDAGFMSGYLAGSSLTECLKIANACGAMSALKSGGSAGQPDQNSLNKFLRSQSQH
ncbi:MAG TPA: carbohydrate kinase family protein [Pyrinomonadaceae bacterium]|nr:carbohydrate kinase family protein [Pyrinomonadaceae bacterium]